MKTVAAALLGLFLLVYIVPLGVRPLVIPDETRYGEIPREMLASGDWTVPHLNGLRYFEKPVLGYWLGALSMKVFGENGFAIRLPSALAAGLSAWIVFLLVRRFAGGTPAGLLAAAILLTFGEVLGVGVFCVLDSPFSLFVTAAIASFYFAWRADTRAGRLLYLVTFGLACGLGFLTKGFLAFAFPAVTIAPFLLWERRWRDLFTLPWIPVAVGVLVALPWCLKVHFREPDFWHYFFWTEHIQRFTAAKTAQLHPEPFFYFVPILLAGALPWTVLAPAAVSGLRRDTGLRESPVRFALCWLAFPFLLLSCSGGKLGTYILPCFPPLAILLAMGLLSYFRTGGGRAFSRGTGLLMGVTGVAGVLLALHHLTGFPVDRAYSVAESGKVAAALLGLFVWAALLSGAMRAPEAPHKLARFCAGPVLLLIAGPFLLPGQVIERKSPGGLLLRHADRVTPDTTLVADKRVVGAACWYYKRTDVYLASSGGELTYGLGYDDARFRLLHLDNFQTVMAREGAVTGRVVLVAKTKHFRGWLHKLPDPTFMEEEGSFIFAEFNGSENR